MADIEIDLDTGPHLGEQPMLDEDDLINYESDAAGDAQLDAGEQDVAEPETLKAPAGEDDDYQHDAADEDHIEEQNALGNGESEDVAEEVDFGNDATDGQLEVDYDLSINVQDEQVEEQEDEEEHDLADDIADEAEAAAAAADEEQDDAAAGPAEEADNDEINWEQEEETGEGGDMFAQPDTESSKTEPAPLEDAAETKPVEQNQQDEGEPAFPSITVHYKGEDFPFLSKSSNGFFSNASILDDRMDTLLAALRSELEDEMAEQDEVVFQIDELGLEFCESSLQETTAALTLRQLLDIYDLLVKNQDPTSSRTLYTFVLLRPNPTRRYETLVEAASTGKGLDELIHLFHPHMPSSHEAETGDNSEAYESPEDTPEQNQKSAEGSVDDEADEPEPMFTIDADEPAEAGDAEHDFHGQDVTLVNAELDALDESNAFDANVGEEIVPDLEPEDDMGEIDWHDEDDDVGDGDADTSSVTGKRQREGEELDGDDEQDAKRLRS